MTHRELTALFRKAPDDVAQELLGRTIRRVYPNASVIEGRILEVSAWRGTHGDNRQHKFPTYPVGRMSVSSRYGQYLADITVERGNSCVTLVGIEMERDGQIYKISGPGNVCRALSIDTGFDGYDIGGGRELCFRGMPAERSLIRERNRSNVPSNCLGYYYIR